MDVLLLPCAKKTFRRPDPILPDPSATFQVVKNRGFAFAMPQFEALLTAQMSVLMVFCGPHLPLAFHFVCGSSFPRTAKKMEGKRKFFLLFVWLRSGSFSFCLEGKAAAVCSINSNFHERTTFGNNCAGRKLRQPQ